MNRKNIVKAFFMPFVILVVLIASLPLMISCSKEAVFGTLTVCESLNKDTYEPVNPKNEFDLFAGSISASINIQNIKGTDNYRFLWKNADTSEIISDVNGKYKEGETRYGSGWFASTATPKAGADVIALPGNYVVEFYHNGELKTSAKFIIKEPVSKILSVSLASEVNENQEPVKTTQEFASGSIIYASVQVNYLIPGDKIMARWSDAGGAVINETPVEIKDAFYKTSWVSFSLEPPKDKPFPAGQYKVEIYLKDAKYNEFPFTVAGPKMTNTVGITFDKGNVFTEGLDKYHFTIDYPDNMEYKFLEDTSGMTVTFTPVNKSDAYSTIMIFLNNASAPLEADYAQFADELAKQSAGGMQQNGTTSVTARKLTDGTDYTEYIYYFKDSKKGEFGLILGFIPYQGNLYVWYGFSHSTFYEKFNAVYYESLSTLQLS